MSIKQRVKEFTQFKKISMRKFESSCGLSNGYFNGVSNAIGRDKMESIILHYPELNPIWLQMGKGEMIIEKENKDLDAELKLQEPHFEYKTMDRLNKIIDLLLKENDQLKTENLKLKEEFENLKNSCQDK